MKLIIISPCYNEEAVIRTSAERLLSFLDKHMESGKISSTSHILYVNDGSKDETWRFINEIHSKDKRIKGLNLSRNVGHQYAISAGMMWAVDKCDAIITIDADLQDDLGAASQMIDRYNEGYEIVYGVKVCRQADPLLKRFSAKMFYRLQEKMGIKTVYNHADFRLLSNRVLKELSLYGERNIYIRGMIPLIGFSSITVDDVISERIAGSSKYNLRRMLMLAIDGITSFSVKPITMIFAAGLFFLLISVIMGIYVLTSYFEHLAVSGWASIMLSLWFIGSCILLSIGIIGQYVSKIYIEVKRRPLYHIESELI